jgi:sugar phosphate isomerase/epimerase
MLYMHSYTYRGQSIQRAARKCREYGYDGLELVTSHYDRAQPEESIAAAVETARAAGTRIAVVDFSGNLIAEDAESRNRAATEIAGIIRLAAKHGALGINGGVGSLVGPDPGNYSENGSRIATAAQYDRAAEGLRSLAQLAASEGIWISLEIHMNTPHDTAASTLKLLELVDHPSVVANLDPGNMYAVADAEGMAEAVRVLGDRLGYVHLKNCRQIAGGYDYSWMLENGDIDLYRGLRAVVESGYTGDYCIEYCGKGDPSVAARADARYFRETLWEASHP